MRQDLCRLQIWLVPSLKADASGSIPTPYSDSAIFDGRRSSQISFTNSRLSQARRKSSALNLSILSGMRSSSSSRSSVVMDPPSLPIVDAPVGPVNPAPITPCIVLFAQKAPASSQDHEEEIFRSFLIVDSELTPDAFRYMESISPLSKY